jgi:hypothetical protein
MARHWISLVTLSLISIMAAAQSDVVVVPPSGGSFVVTDGAGGNKTLEVTSDGEIYVEGNLADFEKPVIVIEAPTTASGPVTIKMTVTDNQGLFEVRTYLPESGDFDRPRGALEYIYEGEVAPNFSGDSVIETYAIDVSGNVTFATAIISSDNVITEGLYNVTPPVTGEFSIDGCGGEYSSTNVYSWSQVTVSGRYRDKNDYFGDRCGSSLNGGGGYANPDSVACVSVGVRNTAAGDFDPFGGASASGELVAGATKFYKEELSRTSSGSFGSDYTYNIIDFEYFDTNPGTLRVELSLRCESDQFGTETVGPFILNATFEAPLP